MSNAEPIAIKSGDIANVLQALQALDGYQEPVGSQIVIRPYKIKGPTRMRMAKWLKSIADAAKLVNDERSKLIKLYCKGKGPDGKDLERVPPESMLEFTDDMQNMMDEPHEFPHAKISVKDILGENDENAIPITVLTALSPIINDDSPV